MSSISLSPFQEANKRSTDCAVFSVPISGTLKIDFVKNPWLRIKLLVQVLSRNLDKNPFTALIAFYYIGKDL